MRRTDPVAEYLTELRRQLPATVSRKRRLLKESEQHLDDAVAELTASGMSRDEAQRIAIRRFGSPQSFAREMGYPSRSEALGGPLLTKPRRAVVGHQSGQTRAQRTGPLVVSVLSGVLLLALLPSSLNIATSDPQETLEYAPVPPEDGAPTLPAGNLVSLSLAGSESLAPARSDPGAGSSSPGADGPLAGGTGKNPTTKRCVGDPPRQTGDPLSPPCVAHFSGDNGGATYAGVTREEIRIVVYFEGCAGQQTSRGAEYTPCSTYIDMAQPPAEDENIFARTVREYSRYFNERYQTYGRYVHFWAYFDGGASTAESRRAEAADHVHKIKPFAAFIGNAFGYVEDWERVLLDRGVLVFRNAQNERAACCAVLDTFRKFAPLLWSVAASAEEYSTIFEAAACSQVVNRPVTFSGMATDQGRPRTLGFILNTRSGYAGETRFATLSREKLSRCGGDFVAEAVNNGACGNADAATAAMASFRERGVTTIVWPGGPAAGSDDCGGMNFTHAAAAVGYYPEVVVAGNGVSEMTLSGQMLNQQFWRNAIMFTPYTRANVPGERPCVQATREAEPNASIHDTEGISCALYDVFRLLFTGIQVAGPRLGPPTMDKGFHAIPAVSSPDNRVPACFFRSGDYSCVKDAMVEWWDPSGKDPGSSSPGCMRMMERGQRYLAHEFPQRDIAAVRRPDDPCNRQGVVYG